MREVIVTCCKMKLCVGAVELISEGTNLNEGRTYESCTLQACFHLNWERGGELRMGGCCGSLPCQRR